MKYLKIIFLLICITGFSQTKVGTINVDYIISNMPELETVNKEVEEYATKLDADLQKQLEDYQAKLKVYREGEATFTDAQKQEKQLELRNVQNDINKFQQNGTKLININRDEKMRPLYTKIGEALDKIAKEQGYTQVLTVNSSLAYYDNNFDVTRLVLKELGIKIEEE